MLITSLPVRNEEEDVTIDDVALLKLAVEAHSETYRDLTQSWRSLETKAQGTAAISGIFLAGAFAFAREIPEGARAGTTELLIVTVLLLVLSAGFSLWVQRIRLMPTAPSSLLAPQWIAAIRSQVPRAEWPERLVGFYEEYDRNWGTTNAALVNILGKKARSLVVAQILLLAAAGCVVGVTILAVLSQTPVVPQ
ncbi:MAG TPA: hypothetical protein VF746_05195 [Longimicrobium sp.]|jgi:hypothetical protein